MYNNAITFFLHEYRVPYLFTPGYECQDAQYGRSGHNTDHRKSRIGIKETYPYRRQRANAHL